MSRRNNVPTKYLIKIKNKWTNSTKSVKVSRFSDPREAHKFAYYNYTTNLEEITEMVDPRGRKVFNVRHGFRD